MKTTTLTWPELILIAATRGILGAGIALLISKRLSDAQRDTAGVLLTAIGALTTIPLVFEVLSKTEGDGAARSRAKARGAVEDRRPVEAESFAS